MGPFQLSSSQKKISSREEAIERKHKWRKEFSALSSFLHLRLLQHPFHSMDMGIGEPQDRGFQETRLANASTPFLALPMHTGETPTSYVGQMGLDSALSTATLAAIFFNFNFRH